MIIHNPILTGSFTVNGTDVASITSSAASITAINAYTASQNILNGTYATTGSNTFAGIQTVNSNLVVTGSITAQTLVVQTVTSSVVYSSGSNVFGNNIANTQVFTGSMNLTGSLTVVTTGTEFQVTSTGVRLGNVIGDAHNITGSVGVSGSATFLGSITAGGKFEASFSNTNTSFDNNSYLRLVNTGTSTLNQRIDLILRWADGTYNGTGGISMIRESATARSGKLILQPIGSDGNNVEALTISSNGVATFASSLRVGSATGNFIIDSYTTSRIGIRSWTDISGTTNNFFVQNSANFNYGVVGVVSASGTSTGDVYALGYTPSAGTSMTPVINWTSGGNVGIGTADPAGILTAQQSNANSITTVTIDNSASAPASAGTQGTILRFRSRIDDGNIRTTGAIASYAMKTTGAGVNNHGDLRLYTGQEGDTNERMRITSGGFMKASNYGGYFGATSNYHELGTNSNGNWNTIMFNTSTGPYGLYIPYTSASPNNTSSEYLYLTDSSALRFSVRSNGGIANFQANNVNLSDERTKKDIIPLESYWDKFKAIEIVKFKYKDQTHEDFNIGVIAQQVEAVAPEFVDVDSWEKPKLDENGNEIVSNEEPLKSIYTADLHHATIKVLQEAMAKIEALETEITELKNK